MRATLEPIAFEVRDVVSCCAGLVDDAGRRRGGVNDLILQLEVSEGVTTYVHCRAAIDRARGWAT